MNRFFTRSRLLAVLLFSAALMAAWWLFRASPPGIDPALRGDDGKVSPARARALYRRHCSSCHGERGDGRGPVASLLDPPPRDFRSDTVANKSDRELRRVIREGRSGTGMPAWKGVLSGPERRALVRYIRRRFGREGDSSPDV